MNTNTKIILGLIGAAAAGAVIGMLVAPEKGSDLRKRIKNTTSDWAGQLKDMISSSKEDLEEKADNATNGKYSRAKESLS